MKRIAAVCITYEELRNLLGLDEDQHVVGVTSNVGEFRLQVFVEGTLMPLQPTGGAVYHIPFSKLDSGKGIAMEMAER